MNKYAVSIDGYTFDIELALPPQDTRQFTINIDGKPITVRLPEAESTSLQGRGYAMIIVDDRPYEVNIDVLAGMLNGPRGVHKIDVRDKQAAVARPQSGDSRIKAPIPGIITQVMVSQGQSVEAGQPLMVLEAMKMENEIRAPRAGVVNALYAEKGRTVTRAEVLIEIGG